MREMCNLELAPGPGARANRGRELEGVDMREVCNLEPAPGTGARANGGKSLSERGTGA